MPQQGSNEGTATRAHGRQPRRDATQELLERAQTRLTLIPVIVAAQTRFALIPVIVTEADEPRSLSWSEHAGAAGGGVWTAAADGDALPSPFRSRPSEVAAEADALDADASFQALAVREGLPEGAAAAEDEEAGVARPAPFGLVPDGNVKEDLDAELEQTMMSWLASPMLGQDECFQAHRGAQLSSTAVHVFGIEHDECVIDNEMVGRIQTLLDFAR